MSTGNEPHARHATSADRPRDEGAVLTLVLVLMVISALIVIPLLSYSISVLRANQVVSDGTRDREAAEGGLRIALLDTTDLFTRCVGNSRRVQMPAGGVVDGVAVSTSCALVDEVGPLNMLGFQNPVGSAALQLGAEVPEEFIGTKQAGPEIPPYPADERWWDSTPTATTDEIWLPELPTAPGTPRTKTPFDMPASFSCKVFLPGRYTEAITVSSGNVYFASGVYYFENTVTIERNANVVVGYGLEELPTDCADDVQVGANLIGAPGTFEIDGVGATWVFGKNGHLVVDNSQTTTGLSLRFNQRYVQTGYEADRGQRISIMSVNGDDTTTADHIVRRVVSVPRSTVSVDQTSGVALGAAGANYAPSSSTYTSEARAPFAPANPAVTVYTVEVPPPVNLMGAMLVEWDAVTGQAAGGALIDAYDVTWTSNGEATPQPVCTGPSDIVAVADGRLACAVRDLPIGRTYTFSVTAHNDAGFTSPAATATARTESTAPLTSAPAAPTIDSITAYQGAAEIAWTPGADNGAPITGYTVTAQRVYLVPQTPADDGDDDGDDGDDGDDVLPPVETYETLGECTTASELWTAVPTSCIINGLPALPSVDPLGNTNVGYRFVITATNSVGVSAEGIHVPTPAVLSFVGDAVPVAEPPAERLVEPWLPEPIVDLRLTADVSTTVSIPGYIVVPMGRVSVDNPNAENVRLIGGLLASTFAIDANTLAGDEESASIGYQSEIVLQRKIRLVSVAGNTRASAVVQVNEDGQFAVNSWVVQ